MPIPFKSVAFPALALAIAGGVLLAAPASAKTKHHTKRHSARHRRMSSATSSGATSSGTTRSTGSTNSGATGSTNGGSVIVPPPVSTTRTSTGQTVPNAPANGTTTGAP